MEPGLFQSPSFLPHRRTPFKMQPPFRMFCCCRHSAAFSSLLSSCIILQPSKADELSTFCPSCTVCAVSGTLWTLLPLPLALSRKQPLRPPQPFSTAFCVPGISPEPCKQPRELCTCCIQVTWETAGLCWDIGLGRHTVHSSRCLSQVYHSILLSFFSCENGDNAHRAFRAKDDYGMF